VTHSTSQNPTNIRVQVGSAIWLLLLFLQYTPADWTGKKTAWVASGAIVSDPELLTRLGISLSVLKRWRRKLHKLGFLGWLLSPRNGRAYWVASPDRLFPEAQAIEQADSSEANKPALTSAQAVWKAVQERSIALTGKVVEDLDPAEGLRLAAALVERSKNPSESPVSGC
jgi:hypothetical protein